MAVAAFLTELLGTVGVGDELVPGARLVETSTELGPRLTFVVAGQEVHVEVAPRSAGRPSAAQSRHLSFAYRAGQGQAQVRSEVGLGLCRALANHVQPLEERALQVLAASAASAKLEDDAGVKVREVRAHRLLEPAGTPQARFFTLSPYVGCLIGCRFCYAHSLLKVSRALEALPEVPWGSYVDVRVSAPELLAEELSRLAAHPIKFCPIVSDPYQAVEQRYRLTRRCLEVLRQSDTPRAVFVLTRSGAIEDDIPLLAAIPRLRAGFSLPTEDDEVRRHFELRGAPISERLRLLGALREHGVRTFAVVQPLLTRRVEALADTLAGRVDSVSIDVLHGEQGAAAQFAHSDYAVMRDAAWQAERAAELASALRQRGIAVWDGELPADLEANP